MELGRKLKEIRKSKGLTLQEVADKINVSKTTLLRWESGATQKMPSKKIEALAKILNISPLYFIYEEDQYLQRDIPTETELLKLFREMNVENKVELLHYAYVLSKENKL